MSEEKEIKNQKDLLMALLQQNNISEAEMEKELQEILESRAQAPAGPEMPPPTEEMLVLGRLHYLLIDNTTRHVIFTMYPQYQPAYIAINHLTRTSNLDPWDFKQLVDTYYFIVSLCRSGQVKLAMAYAMRMIGYIALRDALDGWRGRLVTTHKRTLKIEGEEIEKDRGRWLERIFGR